MKNQELAAVFAEIADALELKGEMAFKVLAYRKAARTIETLTEDIAELARTERLRDVPGIGEGIAKKVIEYLATGRMKKLDEALAGLSEDLLALLKVQGLGPKTLALLHARLKVNNLADLKRSLDDDSARELPGMGEKKIENLKQGVARFEQVSSRLSLDAAMAIAEQVVAHLRQLPVVRDVTPAGSLRRCKETVGDIDILVTGTDAAAIVARFTAMSGIERVLNAGDTKASVLLRTGPRSVQVDLRVLPDDSFGAALQYFTGSKEHNVKLRGLARDRGLKVSEYGVFQGEKQIAGRTEAEVYAALKMPVPPPEVREDRGEIEAALAGELPKLVELEDIKGDLHIHTRLSDGVHSLEEMVVAAQRRGYRYIAITDHTVSAAYAGGLSIARLEESIAAIDELNGRLSAGFHVLKGAEVDIRLDGRLDYPDKVLARLDIVVASIHQSFKHSVTERICSALANPYVTVIAHPSGRLISRRQGYDVDLAKVLECARKFGKALELNAYPDRLDLNEIWLRRAKEMGVPIVISTDSHAVPDLEWMKYGVAIARRGWLEPRDILNCRPLPRLRAALHRT
jgi:DNA polymerase (family 10)